METRKDMNRIAVKVVKAKPVDRECHDFFYQIHGHYNPFHTPYDFLGTREEDCCEECKYKEWEVEKENFKYCLACWNKKCH